MWFKTHELVFTDYDMTRYTSPLKGDELAVIINAHDVDAGTVRAQQGFLQNMNILWMQLVIDPTRLTKETTSDQMTSDNSAMFQLGYSLQEVVLYLDMNKAANDGTNPSSQLSFFDGPVGWVTAFSNLRQGVLNALSALPTQRLLSAMTPSFQSAVARYNNEYGNWSVHAGVTVKHYQLLKELNMQRLSCVQKD